MRRSLLAIGAAILLGLTLAQARAADKVAPSKPATAETCGEYGTSVHFEKTPSEAARKALKEEKLVFVLHISGHFEDPDFT